MGQMEGPLLSCGWKDMNVKIVTQMMTYTTQGLYWQEKF